MALYQFYLAVVPMKGLLMKHGQVPDKIIVKIENSRFYSMTGDYWELLEVDTDEIISEMDRIIKEYDLFKNGLRLNWKTDTDKPDNDASMSINDETGKIQEFIFRFDLREGNLEFLSKMIDLGRKYSWMFMDMKGNLVTPDLGEIKRLICKSKKAAYLKNLE